MSGLLRELRRLPVPVRSALGDSQNSRALALPVREIPSIFVLNFGPRKLVCDLIDDRTGALREDRSNAHHFRYKPTNGGFERSVLAAIRLSISDPRRHYLAVDRGVRPEPIDVARASSQDLRLGISASCGSIEEPRDGDRRERGKERRQRGAHNVFGCHHARTLSGVTR
ncbi:Uncharacterised protein [Streptococcus pyogenes]|nr:Uncharacterised protein [Streptococcus pyogenes]